jgi:AcrR family transcriptional regulator
MPSVTFFNLKVDKRDRIVAAAMREFTQCPFEEASIKNIIEDAGIPRGSFYQYFADKEDLFLFLLQKVKREVDEQNGMKSSSEHKTIFDYMLAVAKKEGMGFNPHQYGEDKYRMLKFVSQSPIAMHLFDSMMSSYYRTDPTIKEFLQHPMFSSCTELEIECLFELLISSVKTAIFSMIHDISVKKSAISKLETKIELLRRSFET